MRRAFTLLELTIAMTLLSVVLAAAWTMFRQGTHENADSEALTELLRAEAVLDATLGGDLDRLVVEPGCRPAGLTEAGQSLAFYVARELPEKPGDVVADPVVYRLAADGEHLGLWRNDRRMGGVLLARGRFDVREQGQQWLVGARFTVLGSTGGWRLPLPPGGRWDLCRAYTPRAALPGLERWVAPSSLIPGESR